MSATTADRFDYVTAHDVFGSLTEGGSISVEEWPGGDMHAVAKELDGKVGVIVVRIDQDIVGGAPIDTVSMHPDECDRLALIGRAIQALEHAREALKSTGYVDGADRP
jgi:hypothetical protein